MKQKIYKPLYRPTLRDVKTLSRGKIPPTLESRPFVIIRQMIKMVILSETGWSWGIVVDPNDSEPVEISRETAREIIKAHKMTKALTCQEGSIYEMPDTPFRKTWKSNKHHITYEKKNQPA